MIVERYTIQDLIKIGKPIACFGSGKGFDKFFELFEDTGLLSRVKFIVDNDEKKSGTCKEVNGNQIRIISPDLFLDEMKSNSFFCIISLGKKGKEEILSQYTNLDISAAWAHDVMSIYCTEMYDHVALPVELPKEEAPRIPKVIHYCWFGKREMPKENRVWIESWQKFCPDYEIVQWNEDNYDISKNRYMKDAYDARRFGFASDYARLDIVYEHGGIYLDTDVELVKPLDELRHLRSFFGWEDGLRVATGLGFGSVPKSDLIREMRDMYDSLQFIRPDGSHDLTACPAYQTKVLQKYGLVKDGTCQTVRGATVLPVTYLCGEPGGYVKRDTRTSETFSVHHFQGSWRYTD